MNRSGAMAAIAHTACLFVLMPPEVTTAFHTVILCLAIWDKASYKTDNTFCHLTKATYHPTKVIYQTSLLSSSHNKIFLF